MDSEGDSILDDVRSFSETEETQMKSGVPITKTFSDYPGISELPKTSKVGLKYATLKVKQFSCLSEVKTYSIATVKERVRYGKMSPRM